MIKVHAAGPWEQEAPYGTRKTINGEVFVYMPDPWTFPEGYGNAWCNLQRMEKDGIPIRNAPDQPSRQGR